MTGIKWSRYSPIPPAHYTRTIFCSVHVQCNNEQFLFLSDKCTLGANNLTVFLGPTFWEWPIFERYDPQLLASTFK